MLLLAAGVLIGSNHVPSGSRQREARFRTLDAVIVRAAVCCHGGFKAARDRSQPDRVSSRHARKGGRTITAAVATYAYDQIDRPRAELKAVSKQTTYETLKISYQRHVNANGCVVDAAVRRVGDDALRRRMPTVIDLDGAWLGVNASVRVMNLAVRK